MSTTFCFELAGGKIEAVVEADTTAIPDVYHDGVRDEIVGYYEEIDEVKAITVTGPKTAGIITEASHKHLYGRLLMMADDQAREVR